MSKVRIGLAFVLVVVTGLVIAPQGASAQIASAGQKVAFSRQFELRTIKTNGHADHLVGSTPLAAAMGVLSPDGTKIAYASDHIELVGTDGTGHVNVTPGGGMDQSPTWNRTGTRIGFTRYDVATGQAQFFTINPNGTGLVKETNSTTTSVFQPMFSPTEDMVAFSQRTPADSNRYDLCVMESDGDNVECLATSLPDFEGPGDWSPNGTKIAYTKYSEAQDQADVFTIHADGTHRVNVTRTNHTNETDPMWPAGGYILFEFRGSSDDEIHRIRPNDHGAGEALTRNHLDDALQDST